MSDQSQLAFNWRSYRLRAGPQLISDCPSARSLDFNVTANYNGDYILEADSFLLREPYTIMNTSPKSTFSGAQMSVSAFARFLLDEQGIMPATTQSTGYPAADPIAPGAFGAAVQVRF